MDKNSVNPRILHLPTQYDLISAMQEIGVDQKGIHIMIPKTELICVKLYNIESKWCNILKQELLSIGGDLAVSKNLLYQSATTSDCLIIGTLTHLNLLLKKLDEQPQYLRKLKQTIEDAIDNFKREEYALKLPNKTIDIKPYNPLIMGILNLTPDSFSNDGVYQPDKNMDISKIIDRAFQIQEEGADIIDLGGESTHPGSEPISVYEELKRVISVLERLVDKLNIPISIDTYKSKVAEEALNCGADILNDISGLTADKEMYKIISKYKPAVIIMHMKGKPKTMQQNPHYDDIMGEITGYFRNSIALALEAGLKKENIILDPGIGFGKTVEHNLFILRNLKEFKSLGYPILIGPSRKSFIGKILGLDVSERLLGTTASIVLAIANGVNIVRVHDITQMRQVCEMSKSILTP